MCEKRGKYTVRRDDGINAMKGEEDEEEEREQPYSFVLLIMLTFIVLEYPFLPLFSKCYTTQSTPSPLVIHMSYSPTPPFQPHLPSPSPANTNCPFSYLRAPTSNNNRSTNPFKSGY